jgi:hypothetical protein
LLRSLGILMKKAPAKTAFLSPFSPIRYPKRYKQMYQNFNARCLLLFTKHTKTYTQKSHEFFSKKQAKRGWVLF